MTYDTVLRLRADALDWRVIDDEVVMLDAEQSQYLATNASGTLIWRMLQAGATRAQLVELLTSTYGIDQQHAAADTDAFLADLRARELIEEG
ncbi:MAG TPA: PqqD family protein [Solirubrobacteraceae bacterium]|nr:PqqD family protein [Solirubrobacteraceae bacterium]